MSSDSISEAAFLLTELRYTLGQLHVQVLDLDASQRREQAQGGRTVDDVLGDMAQHEATYQKRILGLLGEARAAEPTVAEEIPLPISNAESDSGTESQFEHMRAGTIETLAALGDTWPTGLVDLVREQVQLDRHLTTELANIRMDLFNEDSRPDLEEPLTDHPEPHQLEHR